jgi:RNA polymerase sigma-70 factor (ECF subfamily)
MDFNRLYIKEVNSGPIPGVARRDSDVFAELYSNWVGRIYRYVYYLVKDKMTAEDLTQEIFLKAWKSLPSYRGNGVSFSTWLYRIAHNRVMDEFRASRKYQYQDFETLGMQVSHDILDPGQVSEEKELRQVLLETIATLPESQKQVIVLKFIEGLSNKEIEQVTGMRQGTIRITQMRALTLLKGKMGGEVSNGK